MHIDHFKADQNSHLYTALYNFLPPPKFPDPTIKLHKLPSRIEIFWLNPADFFLEILTSSSLSFWRGCIWFFNFIIEEHLNIYNYWDEVAKSIFSHLLSYFFYVLPNMQKRWNISGFITEHLQSTKESSDLVTALFWTGIHFMQGPTATIMYRVTRIISTKRLTYIGNLFRNNLQ